MMRVVDVFNVKVIDKTTNEVVAELSNYPILNNGDTAINLSNGSKLTPIPSKDSTVRMRGFQMNVLHLSKFIDNSSISIGDINISETAKEAKRLISIYERTKNRRIKRKLEKRIENMIWVNV